MVVDDPLPVRTERLVLRRYRGDDRTAFVAMRRHPDVARYQSWPVSYADDAADSFLAEMTTAVFWRPGAWFQVAVERDGTFVGDVAFWPDPLEPIVEIGYSLHPDFQHRGYASEAVGALIRLLRDHGTEVIVAGCDLDNVPSARLLERLGFDFTGIEDGERIYRLAIAGTATFGP
jgi:RimJ/RimL family protein N-acetyltransferase